MIDAEKFQPEVVQWKKLGDGTVERFSELLRQKPLKEKFDEGWIEAVSCRAKVFLALTFKLSFAYYVIMIVLYSAQYQDVDFQLFGLAAKGVAKAKEYLLFVASTISAACSILYSYHEYLISIGKAALRSMAGKEWIEFYQHKHFDSPMSFIMSADFTHARRHTYTKVVFFSTLSAFVVGLALLIVGAFFIQISVIVDIIKNPASPTHVNWFVVVYALTSFFFTLGLSLAKMPLPHVSVENWAKLMELAKSDPPTYRKVMLRLAREDDRKERVFANIVSAATFGLMYPVIAIWNYGPEYATSLKFAVSGVFGLVVISLICPPTIMAIKRLSTRQFFRRYPTASVERLTNFKKLQRFRMAVSYIIPLLLSLLITSFHLARD